MGDSLDDALLDGVFGAEKRACDASRTGIRRGAASFRVDPIVALTEAEGIPAENGRWPAEIGDAGGRFGPEYRSDAQLRMDMLERNKDHQFIMLVAGHANAEVIDLYDAEDIDRQLRLAREEREASAAAAEAQLSATQLSSESERNQNILREKLTQVQSYRARLQTDIVIVLSGSHERAAEVYRAARKVTTQANDWWDFLDICGRPMAARSAVKPMKLLKRIIDNLEDVQVTTLRIEEAADVLVGPDTHPDADFDRPSDLFLKLYEDYTELLESRRPRQTADALDVVWSAVCRYLTLVVLEFFKDDVAAAVLARTDDDTLADIDESQRLLDRALGQINRRETGAAPREGQIDMLVALRYLEEAASLGQFLVTAFAVATAPSPLAIPPAEISTTTRGNRSILEVENRDIWGNAVDIVSNESKIALDNYRGGTSTLQDALSDAHISFSRSIQKRTFWPAGPPPVTEEGSWAVAISTYEMLGGRYLRDLGAKIPYNKATRKQFRGGQKIPEWDDKGSRMPPFYSQKMNVLYEKHAPEWSRLVAKYATGTPLDARDQVFLAVMTGRTRAMGTEIGRQVYTGPMLVFSARLYRAELRLAIFDEDSGIAVMRENIEAADARLRAMTRGDPVRRHVPEAAYRHRRTWTERPENSGVIRLKPTVFAALGRAWNLVSDFTEFGAVDSERLQHLPSIRDDYARLVAMNMADSAQQFPHQYLSPTLIQFTESNRRNIIDRLRRRYEVTPTGTVRKRRGDFFAL